MGASKRQKLIQPLNNMRVTASYKNAAYTSKFGYAHYGLDCADKGKEDFQVWGMGDGSVLDTGNDSTYGNYIVVKYPQVYNRKLGTYHDIIIRMFHFDSVSVSKGQQITKDTRMGKYGSTGTYATAAHLHLEVDTDTVYTHYSPGTKSDTSKFKGRSSGANDLTMSNPLDWFYCKTSSPDNQTYTTNGDAYVNTTDRSIEKITAL